MALQEDKYHKYIQDMHLMLKNYEALVGSLTQVETRLLSRQLQHLQTVLNTGFTPLNWNSQRIPSFIETCNKALNEFSGIVSQIHKSSTMIREVVSRYASFNSRKTISVPQAVPIEYNDSGVITW